MDILRLAFNLAASSTARRLKVGCIILQNDGRIIASSVNRMPEGFGDNCEIEDSEGNLVTKRELIHAEAGAICQCARDGISLKGASLYVTHSPCIDCAKLIAESGITDVYYAEDYRLQDGVNFLKKYGVNVIKVPGF